MHGFRFLRLLSLFLPGRGLDQAGGKVARMICDVYRPNGQPFEGDPRYVLKRAVQQAENMGAGKPKRIGKGLLAGSLMGFGVSAVLLVIVLLFGKPMTLLFLIVLSWIIFIIRMMKRIY